MVMCCVILLLTQGLGYDAGVKEDYEQACKINMAAGACIAAYSDRNGKLANQYLERDGWKIDRYEQLGGLARCPVTAGEKTVEQGAANVHPGVCRHGKRNRYES